MNRSIFQTSIKNKKINNHVQSLLLIIILFFLIPFENKYNCFSLKSAPENLLKDFKYNNLMFKCSNTINDDCVIKSIKILLKYGCKDNFSICKYFEIRNNSINTFSRYSCYSHYNLFFGYYENLYFNLQFSHNVINNNFKYFSNTDLNNVEKTQYLSSQIYIYDNNLKQQFFNSSSLNLNFLTPYKNNNNVIIQNYIDLHKNKFNNVIKKALNF